MCVRLLLFMRYALFEYLENFRKNVLKFYKVQDKMKTTKEIDNPSEVGFESVFNWFFA